MGQYSFTAYCQDAKRRYKLDYSPGFGLIHWHKRGWPTAKKFPAYVEREIEHQIYEAYNANRLTVHEIDQQGDQRRKDYRYHSEELLALSLESLAQEQWKLTRV